MPAVPRILIVTAAFGEGHNSAARNLAHALHARGALTQVADPCMLGAPRLTQAVNCAYRYVTNHLPQVWAAIYRSTDRSDFSRPSPIMRGPESSMAALIEEFQPHAIVSTYPLYPYFLARIFARTGSKLPVFTVITDSIEINASWLRAPTDFWLVTDSVTRTGMGESGVPAGKIIDTGFPVHPDFAKLLPVEASDACDPFRVLYFPTAQVPFIRRHSRALLNASPAVTLTIVLGRNVRLLHARAREIQREFPGRVRIIGWTTRIPLLLNRHHLVVGKAGGATVHEAIAARCPMLIHHLVPGQEEGNLKLLQTIGAGRLAETPDQLKASLQQLLAADSTLWRSMKTALLRHGRNSGAIAAAKFILSEISQPPAQP